MNTTIVQHLNLDTLVASYEARPATRTRMKAWCWLAEQSAARFVGAALVVPSATWSATEYRATPDTCTCPAKGHCWHKEASSIVAAALAEDARYDLEAGNAIWQTAYNTTDTPYHAIAHHEATEALRSARVARTPSIGYTAALADLLECF